MDRKKIAEKLIAMRGEKTQAEVAKSIGISKSSLAMYETGQRVPSFEMLEAIADYFNVPLSSLVDNASSLFPDILHHIWRNAVD